MSAVAPALPRPAGRIDPVVAAGVRAEDVAVLRVALAGLLVRRADVRGASVYSLARGETIVRLFTRRGWVPTLIPAAVRQDGPAILACLESALARRAELR